MSLFLNPPPKLAGKKRKYYTAVEEDPYLNLTGKLNQYLKEMRKVAKKSKTFETRRLVKKLKDLRKLTHVESALEEINDLETQLESLKRTDHERIAHLALSSKIRKDKILTSNDALMASLASAVFTAANTNIEAKQVKVESRLLSSKILAAEAQEAVKGLRAVVEPGMAAKSHSSVRTLEAANNDQERGDEEIDKKLAADARLGLKTANDDSSDEDIKKTEILGEVLNEADDMSGDNGWESGAIDDGIKHAGSDDDDTETNSPPKKTKQPSSSSLLGSLDPSSSIAASRFLPSLSVGYIKGDSDSDIDPSDGETAVNGRKNRRGQRARQAIWEKKYGRNAKHIKKKREDILATATARSLGKRPDQGWGGRHDGDSKPASVSIRAANKKRIVQTHSRGHHGVRLSSEKPVHPSWEAKRKLKEKEGARILPSEGKKIVFT